MTFWKVFQRICACQEKNLTQPRFGQFSSMSGFQYHWQHLVFSIKKVFCALLAKVTYFAFYYVHTGFFPKKCFINAQQIEKSKSKWWCWRTGQKRGKSFIQDFLEFSKHKKSTYITYILQKKKKWQGIFFLLIWKATLFLHFHFVRHLLWVKRASLQTHEWRSTSLIFHSLKIASLIGTAKQNLKKSQVYTRTLSWSDGKST